jgi:hypothetical protein
LSWSIAFGGREWETVLHALITGWEHLFGLEVGIDRHPERSELLAKPGRLFLPPPQDDHPRLWIYGADDPDLLLHTLPALIQERIQHATALQPQAVMALGTGKARGYVTGKLYTSGEGAFEPLEAVRVYAPGLPVYPLRAPVSQTRLEQEEAVRFSRVISGRGMTAFRRISDVRFAIIGVSGIGSPLAETLLKEFGVSALVLIDPDTVQPENLHRMQGVGLADIGRNKVEAVGAYLRTLGSVNLRTAAVPVTSWSALNLLKSCDVWISAVDNGRAKAEIQFLAQLYLRPLLDIGVGAILEHGEDIPTPPSNDVRNLSLRDILGPFARSDRPRRWAADIRLVSPDSRGRCLACLGGFGNVRRGRRSEAEPFWRERVGSSRTMNMAAAHLGMALLEDYITGRLKEESVHIQLDFPEEGLPVLTSARPTPRLRCPFCAALGQGDDALDQMEQVLAQVMSPE